MPGTKTEIEMALFVSKRLAKYPHITERNTLNKFKFTLVSVLAISLLLLPNLSASASVSGVNILTYVLPTPKVNYWISDLPNTLTAQIGKPPKSLKVKYQWLLDGKPITGANSKTYTRQVSDCGKVIQVRVSASSSSSTKVTRTSKSYTPSKTCEYQTEIVPGWQAFHSCSVSGPTGSCTEHDWYEGQFFGYVGSNNTAQSWFRIPVPGIEPSRISNWRALVSGRFQPHALSVIMITSDTPTWTWPDKKGVTFQTSSGFWSSDISNTTKLSADGNAYVGFEYRDRYSLGDYLVIESIQLVVSYR